MTDHMKPHRRLKRVLIAVAALAPLIAGVEYILYLLVPKYPPGFVTGDRLDIRLTGVWRGDDTAIYDVNGNKIGETVGDHRFPQSWGSSASQYKRLRRNFIFEMPPAGDVTFSSAHLVRVAGRRRTHEYTAGPTPLVSKNGNTRFYIDSSFQPRYYFSPLGRLPFIGDPFGRWRLFERVDVTLRYWYGPRGKAQFTFTGPFEAGRTYAADGNAGATLQVSDYFGTVGEWGTVMDFNSTRALVPTFEILVYDKQGARHHGGGGAFGIGSVQLTRPMRAKALGLAPSDIMYVTAGERARERTFHNILVKYAEPEYDVAPYLVDVAKRLQADTADAGGLANFRLTGADNALKVLDVVRGWHIDEALTAIEPYTFNPDQFAKLDKTAQKGILDALELWSAADDPYTRCRALQAALSLAPEQFLDRALEAVSDVNLERRDWVASSFWGRGRFLKAAHVARIGRLIRDGNSREFTRILFQALADCPLPEAQAARVEFANDDNPRFWWNVLTLPQARAVPGSFEPLEQKLKIRRLLTLRLDRSKFPADDRTLAEAKSVLPSLITAEVNESIRWVDFKALIDSVIANCDADAAVATFARFMRGIRDYERAEAAVLRMIYHTNRLKRVSIGGLDPDSALPADPNLGLSIRKLALEYLQWFDTGKAAEDIPSGYRAKAGDMRVLLANGDEAERSAIGLWILDGVPKAVGARLLTTPSADLAFTISAKPIRPPSATGDVPGYAIRCRYNIGLKDKEYYGSSEREHEFVPADLPVTLGLEGSWSVVIERADSPQSVVSGTKVFSDWWAKYGAAISPVQPSGKMEHESTLSALTQGTKE